MLTNNKRTNKQYNWKRDHSKRNEEEEKLQIITFMVVRLRKLCLSETRLIWVQITLSILIMKQTQCDGSISSPFSLSHFFSSSLPFSWAFQLAETAWRHECERNQIENNRDKYKTRMVNETSSSHIYSSTMNILARFFHTLIISSVYLSLLINFRGCHLVYKVYSDCYYDKFCQKQKEIHLIIGKSHGSKYRETRIHCDVFTTLKILISCWIDLSSRKCWNLLRTLYVIPMNSLKP